MQVNSKEEIRSDLGRHYAAMLQAYREKHQKLLDALGDDSVSYEAFEQLSAEVHEEVNALKEMKREMKRQTEEINEEAQ